MSIISFPNALSPYRNRVINGDVKINQRGVTSVALVNNAGVMSADRFYSNYYSGAAGQLTQSVQTLLPADAPYAYGFRSSFKNTVNVAFPSVYNLDIHQVIPGYNIADFNWGSASGSPITVSFWLRCQGSTLFPVSIINNSNTYTYNSNVTVASQNTWQFVVCVIPAPPTGSTWESTTNTGIVLGIGSYGPSMYAGLASTTGWVTGRMVGTTASTNWSTTLNNFVEITGVQLEKGSIATPFEFRTYAVEVGLELGSY